MGNVSATVAGDMVDVWGDYGTLGVALLTAPPTVTSGEWDSDLSSIEIDGTGYSRGELATADIAAAAGNGPVRRISSADVVFDPNSGAGDWDPITHVAVLAASGDVVSVVPLSTPVVVKPLEALVITAGDLQFAVDSA